MSELFPILSVETTDTLCSVAILLNEEDYFEANIQGKHIHSQKLVIMINELLDSADLKISEINCLAVSEGPGSFTGLRIGMAAAKGIAVGAEIPMILVPTFQAAALKIANFLKEGEKFVLVKKASKDDSYLGVYSVSKNTFNEVTAPCLVENDKLSNYLSDQVYVYSNTNLNDKNPGLTIPSAKDVATWAYKFGKDLVTSNYDFVEPKYLKDFLVRTQK